MTLENDAFSKPWCTGSKSYRTGGRSFWYEGTPVISGQDCPIYAHRVSVFKRLAVKKLLKGCKAEGRQVNLSSTWNRRIPWFIEAQAEYLDQIEVKKQLLGGR